MKVLAVQVSDSLINTIPNNNIDNIYSNLKSFGYYRSKHFLEIPLWIAELSGLFKHTYVQFEKYILTDVNKNWKDILPKKYDYILFSVMDCNKEIIREFIDLNNGQSRFIVGGYCNLRSFTVFNNVRIIDSINKLADFLGIDYKYQLNYSLFKGYKTIPRLTLSSGCLYQCKYCTVPQGVTKESFFCILRQIKSFKPLKFKLIYINDKTFFQADNYYFLSSLYGRIKKYNPQFEGFIIQSQVNTINHFKKFNGLLEHLHIKIIELGIESFNNRVLKNMNKPQTENGIVKCLEFLKTKNVKLVLNIMIGLPEEKQKTYLKTLKFLQTYQDDIFFLNIYNLAIYNNTTLRQEIKIQSDNDLNEQCINKSFHTSRENENAYIFSNELEAINKYLIERSRGL